MKTLALIAMALLAAPVAIADETPVNPIDVAQRANAAYESGKYADAAGLYEQLIGLLPRSLSSRVQLARALVRSGKTDRGLDALEFAVEHGVRFDADDAAWAAAKTSDRFRTLVARMRGMTAPIIRSEPAFVMDKDLTPENVAHDPKSGAFFVGSMYKAKIIRIDSAGRITDFIPSRRDGLLSVLGMKVDAARRELWAAAGNFGNRPPLEVPDPDSRGKGYLFRYNIDTAALLGKYPVPEGGGDGAFANDLVIAPNGDVYTTSGPRILRLPAGGSALEPWFERPAFFNGIAMTGDGKTIFGASHFEGVVRIDVATKQAAVIDVPRGVTLNGIDGLYVFENSLIAVQNGTDPMRVVRAWLDPEMKRVTRFAVLEQLHPQSDFPLTGTIVGRDLYYVALSQLRAFDDMKIWPAEKLRQTVVLKLPIDLPGM